MPITGYSSEFLINYFDLRVQVVQVFVEFNELINHLF